MDTKALIFGLCAACFLFAACVSKEKYEQLEAVLADTQTNLEQSARRADKLQSDLKQLEEKQSRCRQDMTALQQRYKELDQAQQELSRVLKEKGIELKEKDSIVQQKEEIIKQVDQARQEIEVSLQTNIEIREKKIEDLETTIAELDNTRRRTETSLNDLKAQIENREQKIKAQEQTITELDSTRRRTETSLNELKARTENQEQAIAVLDSTRIQAQKSLNDLKARIESREQKIKAQEQAIAELDSTRRRIENNLKKSRLELQQREEKIQKLEDALAQLDNAKRQIESRLNKQIKSQQIKLEEMEGKLKVTLVDKILFDSGSVRINQKGRVLLSTLAETLRQIDNQSIVIQGHTDNILIGSELRERYATNWELSVARSTAVLRYLQDEAGIDPQNCSVCGFAFYRPVASNDTADGRRQNRRIDIILAPKPRPGLCVGSSCRRRKNHAVFQYRNQSNHRPASQSGVDEKDFDIRCRSSGETGIVCHDFNKAGDTTDLWRQRKTGGVCPA
jgi:chemotaxis protein MotB